MFQFKCQVLIIESARNAARKILGNIWAHWEGTLQLVTDVCVGFGVEVSHVYWPAQSSGTYPKQ